MALSIVLSFLVAAIGVGMLVRLDADWARDCPNHRSLHVRPVPRVGGLGLLAGFVAGLAAGLAVVPAAAPSPAVLGGLALLALVSLGDDLRGLPVTARLLVQIVAVALALHGLGVPLADWWWLLPLGAWSINLYNFMDGADGLAGGMAVAGFGAMGLALLWWGGAGHAIEALDLAAAAAGFLLWNHPPARIFLGDVGSTSLGYLAFTLALQGVLEGGFGPWLPVIAFAPFLVDSSLTLARRLLRGERVWEPHREHFYQRLVAARGSHRALLRVAWPAMAVCAASALMAEWWLRGSGLP